MHRASIYLALCVVGRLCTGPTRHGGTRRCLITRDVCCRPRNSGTQLAARRAVNGNVPAHSQGPDPAAIRAVGLDPMRMMEDTNLGSHPTATLAHGHPRRLPNQASRVTIT